MMMSGVFICHFGRRLTAKECQEPYSADRDGRMPGKLLEALCLQIRSRIRGNAI